MGSANELKIAVVGAGIAGLTAARRLTDAGLAVTLFDKSNGVGGRMATRKVETENGVVAFDHGVQFVQPTTNQAFVTLVENWERAGVAAKWLDSKTVGVPDMTAIARHMANGQTIIHGQTITGLHQTATGWTLVADHAAGDQPCWQGFAAVLLAIPAPQAIPVLRSAQIDLTGIDDARFDPVWSLMVALDRPLELLEGLSLNTGPVNDVMAWIADNSSKPGRRHVTQPPYCYVLHATVVWSRAHLELDKESARDQLLAALGQTIGGPVAPLYATAHRWRYGLVATPVGRPYLWDAQASVGACGDWCLGDRVEQAFLSGRSLAHAVIDRLGSRSALPMAR
jgi:renalase